MPRIRLKKAECPNCNFRFSETNNYCPNCGQENHTHILPIKHFLVEILEALFHFDAKMFLTIRDLFIPGRITLNYNQNKRARYVPPVRLYIFISFVFFLLLSVTFHPEKEQGKDKESIEADIKFEVDSATIESGKDTAGYYLLGQIRASAHPDELIDSYINIRHKKLNWFSTKMYRNLTKLKTGHLDKEELVHKLYKSFSYCMFFLMPIFALYLLLVYWRKKLYYSEHLIFAIHFHSLVFILLSVWLLLSLVNTSIGFLMVPIILVYFLLLLRKIYGQSWRKTIFKFLLLGFIYTISIFFVLIVGILFSIIV